MYKCCSFVHLSAFSAVRSCIFQSCYLVRKIPVLLEAPTVMHCVFQQTFEFNKGNNQKAKEDVGADVKENYVRYHVKDDDSEVTVIEDFNRVSQCTLSLI